jgi:hypothetical protein
VLRRAEDINAEAHGSTCDEGGAMDVRTAITQAEIVAPVSQFPLKPCSQRWLTPVPSRMVARQTPAAVIGPQQADARTRAGVAAIIAITVWWVLCLSTLITTKSRSYQTRCFSPPS